MLEPKFGVVVADPPWRFRDRGTPNRRLSRCYGMLSLKDICELPVARFALPNSVLLLWCPSAMVRDGLRVMAAWGFDYETMAVWVKPRIGMGHYFRSAHELVLLGTRGRPEVKFYLQPSWFFASVQDDSHKPEELYDIVERMFNGPYLEMFARRRRPGWGVWGDQVE